MKPVNELQTEQGIIFVLSRDRSQVRAIRISPRNPVINLGHAVKAEITRHAGLLKFKHVEKHDVIPAELIDAMLEKGDEPALGAVLTSTRTVRKRNCTIEIAFLRKPATKKQGAPLNCYHRRKLCAREIELLRELMGSQLVEKGKPDKVIPKHIVDSALALLTR